jgi:hypothetical protein
MPSPIVVFPVLKPIILTFALAVAPLLAQTDRGSLTGTVADISGGLVRGARVEAVNSASRFAWRAATGDTGQYTIPNLPPGVYDIAVEAAGFKKSVRSAVRIDVGQSIRVDARLEPGAVIESVELIEPPALLETEKSETGTLIDGRQAVDFPLSFAGGRSPEDFAYKLAPGVQGDNWMSRVNGSPAFSKEVLLDGASVTTYIAGHFGESSVSLEALEEFRVQTSGYSAEFGRTGGGIFNFIMKSGGNQLHGSAMGQLRNEWMDANSFLNNAYGRPKQRDRRDNYAFSLGGPAEIPHVYKAANRTFFFVAFERYAETNAGLGSPSVTVPLTEWWTGDMSRYLTTQSLGKDALGSNVLRGQIYDPASTQSIGGKLVRTPFAGNIIPSNRISAVSRKLGQIMTQDYAPVVKQSDGQYALINNSFFPAANTASFYQTQFSLKADHNLSSRQKLSGSWEYVDRPRILLDQGGVWNAALPDGGPLSRARSQDVHSQMARLSHDFQLSPNLLNHALVAFNRQINPSQSSHLGEDGVAQLGLTGLAGQGNFPEIIFSGGDRVSLPRLGYTADGILAATSYEFADTLSWLRGRHSFKFGYDTRRNQLNDRDTSGPASFTFNAVLTGQPGFSQTGSPFASMLLGQVSSASVVVDTPTGSRFRYEALFAQDDFKLSPRVTLNLGLRWEYQPVQTEAHDRLNDFCTTCTDPSTGLPGAMIFAGSGPGRTGHNGFEKNHWNNFAPRLGLAAQIAHNVVFRAAYGMVYAPRVPNDYSGAPYYQKVGFAQQNAVNDPGNGKAAFNWDQGYPGKVTSAAPDPGAAAYTYGLVWWDPNGGKVPYVQQWNAGFQFGLPRKISVEANYMGNKSTGLYGNALANINQIPAAALKLKDSLGDYIGSSADISPAAKALGARYPYSYDGNYIPLQQALQPFPQVPYWNQIYAWNSPLGFGTWNAAELTVARREGRLTWLASYTFSKTISNMDSAFNSYSNYGRPQDYHNLSLDKSISPYDQTHSVKYGIRYELPLGRGLLRAGWTLQLLGQYSSGFPLSFYGTPPYNANFAGYRADIVNPSGQSLYAGFNASAFDISTLSTPGRNQYVNTSLVRDPAPYMLGNASFATSQIRGFGFANEDLGIQKNFRFRERVRAQFRAEFLNVFNRHRFSGIDTNAASPLFGQVTGLDAGAYRQTQVGMRVDF